MPRWPTIVGQHVARSSAPPVLALVTLSLTLAIAFISSSNVWSDGLGGSGDRMVTLLLIEWTTVLCAVGTAIFAAAGVRTEPRWEAVVLALLLPLAALIDGVTVMRAWPAAHSVDAATAAPSASATTGWFIARLLFGLGLIVLGWLAGTRQTSKKRTLAVTGTSVVLATLGIATALALANGWTLPFPHRTDLLVRPWELPSLFLVLVAGLIVLPRFHRTAPSTMSYALLISMVPLAAAQVQAILSSASLNDPHCLGAYLQKLLASLVVTSGIVLDYVAARSLSDQTLQEMRSTQRELAQRTQEIQRIDLALAEEERERRRIEEQLRVLGKAVATMRLGLTISDTDGKILYVNPADAAMHGYSVGELIGQRTSVFAPSDSLAHRLTNIAHWATWDRERLNRRRDGSVFPVRIVSDVVRDESNEPMALVSICEDISDRRRAEEALSRRDRILEAVGLAAERFLSRQGWEESVGDVLATLGRATGVDRIYLTFFSTGEANRPRTFSWRNSRASLDETRASDIPSRSTLLTSWQARLTSGTVLCGTADSFPPDERGILQARGIGSIAVVPVLVEDQCRGFLSLETGDQDRRWSSSELEALRTAARTLGAAIHRREFESALLASERRYRHLIESASDLIQSVALDGRFLFVNRAWLESLGYSSTELAGLTLWDVLHPRHHEHCRTLLSQMALQGGGRLDVSFLTKDSREIHVEGSVGMILEGDRPAATLGIFRDISERKRIDQMKQDFISVVSHELRTPLTSMIGSLALLKGPAFTSAPERGIELLEIAYRNAERLLKLINDLLDLQRLAAGELTLQIRTVPVGALVLEAVEATQGLAASFQVTLRVEEPLPNESVQADRDRLIQILQNLLSNAIKFSPRKGEVLIRARVQGEHAVLSVTDRGPGIPVEFRRRLFEKFAQADQSTTRAASGSGLGLSIVKSLADRMDARVLVDTEVGVGSTFSIELPLAAAPNPPATASLAARHG